jgi:hypothetical protein
VGVTARRPGPMGFLSFLVTKGMKKKWEAAVFWFSFSVGSVGNGRDGMGALGFVFFFFAGGVRGGIFIIWFCFGGRLFVFLYFFYTCFRT